MKPVTPGKVLCCAVGGGGLGESSEGSSGLYRGMERDRLEDLSGRGVAGVEVVGGVRTGEPPPCTRVRSRWETADVPWSLNMMA